MLNYLIIRKLTQLTGKSDDMKIFVPTTTHPSKSSSPVLYIKNILKNLKTVSCVWLLYQPQKFQTSHSSKETVLDIHDYNNAVQF